MLQFEDLADAVPVDGDRSLRSHAWRKSSTLIRIVKMRNAEKNASSQNYTLEITDYEC